MFDAECIPCSAATVRKGWTSNQLAELVLEEEQTAFRAAHPIEPNHSVPPVVTYLLSSES